jgi:hypothetical protein
MFYMPTTIAVHAPLNWRDRLAMNIQQGALVAAMASGRMPPYAYKAVRK